MSPEGRWWFLIETLAPGSFGLGQGLGICVWDPSQEFRKQGLGFRVGTKALWQVPEGPRAPTLFSLTLQARGNHGDVRGHGQAARHSFRGKPVRGGRLAAARAPQLSELRRPRCWWRNVCFQWGLRSSPSEPQCVLLCPQSLLIFKDLKLRGFWLSQWKKDHSPGECVVAPLPGVTREGRACCRSDQTRSPG